MNVEVPTVAAMEGAAVCRLHNPNEPSDTERSASPMTGASITERPLPV
jgi:hypothetical protein